MISIIVALDEKRGIGKGNDLLFRIPEDFKRMQAITIGHPIIMGRKTYESIGRVLPKRINIIVTKDTSYNVDGAIVTDSLENALEIGKQKEEERVSLPNTKYQILNTDEEIFIFGGGMLFKEALDKELVDKLYLTLVKGDYHADIFFPEYEKAFPTIIDSETKSDQNYTYTFETRER
ncbi:MAG: dihydrofolate reductase [Candidatus Levybacteria bacterium]|nr:dihydrofolate reductase [Candidatus Levybacteria bacterium]